MSPKELTSAAAAAKAKAQRLAETNQALQEFLQKDDTPKPQEVFHTLAFLEDVPQTLQAEVARTEIPLGQILSWKLGSVIEFRKIIGEPIEVLLGDRVIAKGEVVVVNDRYGVRIHEITRPDERLG